MSCRYANCNIVKLVGFTASVCVLFWVSACFGSEVKEIGGGEDYGWWYKGEVEAKPIARPTCMTSLCSQYCDISYCAHGFGSLDPDTNWNYNGTFVHGRIEGHGVLACLGGARYEGTFVDGKMSGLFTVRTQGRQKTLQFSNQPVGSGGPCD